MIDPLSPDPAMRAHRERCKACAAEAERAAAFEVRLRAALADETQGGRGLEHPGRAPRKRLALAALGFGLLLIGLGWVMQHQWREAHPPQRLAALAVAHVRAELPLLDSRRTTAAPADKTERLLRDLGAGADVLAMAATPRLRYAARCAIGGAGGAHLVLDGERGPVTALYMPEQRTQTPGKLEAGRFDALVIPTEHGTLALVGEGDEPLEKVVSRFPGFR